jgi:hypothetical protein
VASTEQVYKNKTFLKQLSLKKENTTQYLLSTKSENKRYNYPPFPPSLAPGIEGKVLRNKTTPLPSASRPLVLKEGH